MAIINFIYHLIKKLFFRNYFKSDTVQQNSNYFKIEKKSLILINICLLIMNELHFNEKL